jgi:hypothetical protein
MADVREKKNGNRNFSQHDLIRALIKSKMMAEIDLSQETIQFKSKKQ